MISIRNEVLSDAAALEAVILAALESAEYSSGAEQFIARALREAGQLVVSLVALRTAPQAMLAGRREPAR